MPDIDARVLSRTLVTRQLLDRRQPHEVLDVVEHLVALQSQEPNWPYLGLWSRIEGFALPDLTTLLAQRRVVRGSSVRSTQHLVSAADHRWLRATVQPVLDKTLRSAYVRAETTGLDVVALAELGADLLGRETMTRAELGRLLVARHPGRRGTVLAAAVELQLPVVHPPPGPSWGGWGTRSGLSVAAAEHWITEDQHAPSEPLHELVRRYLRAFGPASVKDLQAWSGLTRMASVVAGLRTELVAYRGPGGTELLDLPDVPLADPDLELPVRFLPAFDNILLGHADRTRIISDDHRKLVMPGQAAVRPTILVDGLVAGLWSLRGPELVVEPFRRLSAAETTAVRTEGAALLEVLRSDEPDLVLRLAD